MSLLKKLKISPQSRGGRKDFYIGFNKIKSFAFHY